MSTEKKTDVQKIITSLFPHVKCLDNKGFCANTGIEPGTLKKWIQRGKIANVAPIIDVCPGLSPKYLQEGAGEMFLLHPSPPNPTSTKEIEMNNAELIAKLTRDMEEIKEDLRDIKTEARELRAKADRDIDRLNKVIDAEREELRELRKTVNRRLEAETPMPTVEKKIA